MIGAASAPASAGNIGPGFDVLAMALSLRCNVTAEPSDTLTVTEGGSTKRLDDDDMVAMAVRMAVDRPMHLTIDSEIPSARGLGSSSAVTAAAAAAAMKSMGAEGGRERVFTIVNELEGHADNAAAAVFGGFVAAVPSGIQRLALHESLVPIVGIPESILRTSKARAALSNDVPRPVVVRSISRLAFLIEGLRTANADALAHAAGDELHEQPRASMSPITGELMHAARHGGAMHVCWSGAGPSALAFAPTQSVGRVIGAMAAVLGTHGEVLSLEIDHEGLR